MFFFFMPDYIIMKDPEWEALVEVLDLVRGRYPKMTVGTLCTFIEIARTQKDLYQHELVMTDIAEKWEIPYPTLARQTDLLGDGLGKRDGLKLIKKVNTPNQNKTKFIDITPEGRELLLTIYGIINKEGGFRKERRRSRRELA